MIIVRPAEQRDLGWVIEQLREFEKFVDTKTPLFPPEDEARTMVSDWIDKHVFFVSEYCAAGIEVLTGFTMGILHPNFFNYRITVLSEMFWWVAPQYRGTRSGALLLQELERVGREHADWTVVSLERHSPVRPETLERRGFKKWETAFLRESRSSLCP